MSTMDLLKLDRPQKPEGAMRAAVKDAEADALETRPMSLEVGLMNFIGRGFRRSDR
jgi:hypothetical protein